MVVLLLAGVDDRKLEDPTDILLDELPIRATLATMARSTRRAGLYVRVSTSERGQIVKNQLQPLQEAAGRLGCRHRGCIAWGGRSQT
jgi:hypothetical protein